MNQKSSVMQLPKFVPKALTLFNQVEQRNHSVRVLLSGLHGICLLARVGALPKSESVTAMADFLITHYVIGLRLERTR